MSIKNSITFNKDIDMSSILFAFVSSGYKVSLEINSDIGFQVLHYEKSGIIPVGKKTVIHNEEHK